MKKLIQILLPIIAVVLILYAAVEYWDEFRMKFFAPSGSVVIYIDETPFAVTVADTPSERQQGLSGTKELGQFEGKLFVFDRSANHGIWMKDMNYPIDILWFDEEFRLIHSVGSVGPETYPEIFAPDSPAKYVVELHSDTVRSLQLQEGDTLLIPPSLLPGQ